MSSREYMNHRNRIILETPASWAGNRWREALPSGNGKIGAAVYGGVKEETVLLNHEALWSGEMSLHMPDVGYTLQQTRALMDEGKYHEANRRLADELLTHGYDPGYPTPLPLGDLRISMPVRGGFRDYARMVDMESGEVTVRWNDNGRTFHRTLFVSRSHQLVVCRITADKGTVDAKIGLTMHDVADSRNPLPPGISLDTLEVITEVNASKANDPEADHSQGTVCYALQNDDGSDFGAVAGIIAINGEITKTERSISVTGADSILVLTKLFVKGERHEDWLRLKEELRLIDQGYESLLASHVKLHAPLFHGVSIELEDGLQLAPSNEQLLLQAYRGEAPAQLIEKMWRFGRYLFISSTGEDGQPCPLYGLWCGDYQAIFSQNVANVNMEMIYWHAPAGGLSGHLKALIDYLYSKIDQFRENARKLFGVRGIYISSYSTPGFGKALPVVPVILNWTGAAGWLAQHGYAYYQFTGDIDLLKSRILPFMREAALFYEDFFVEGEDGYLIAYPSVSPENSPGNYQDDEADQLEHPLPTTINATMDFAIAKELLHNLIEACRKTGMYQEEIGNWEEMLRRIPPYQRNEDGAFREWLHEDFTENYHHRHMSHLYPLFPGTEITKEKHAEWFEACSVAMHKRLSIGLGDQSGWSLMFLGNLYARLEDGEHAKECLDLLTRSCIMDNLFTVHNDWRDMGITLTFEQAPFQIDANIGLVSAVQEMLLYVSSDLIKLLPALPLSWKHGRVNGLHFHTGTVDMEWDRKSGMFKADLHAVRDTKITIKLPAIWGDPVFIGDSVRNESSPLGPNYREIEMWAGSRLSISNAKGK